jgi:hypothetical protein
MSKRWGPIGWMTLHSISLNYPIQPSYEDKLILKKFFEKFANTISCPSCQLHFRSMFELYKQHHPEWAESRYDLFLFVARAHNTVNRRLDKPVIQTIEDCLTTIKNNSVHTSLKEFRQKYIDYLVHNWGAYQTGDGRIMMHDVRELQKINNEYWNLRDNEDVNNFPETDITEAVSRQPVMPYFPIVQRTVGFTLKGGRFLLKSK